MTGDLIKLPIGTSVSLPGHFEYSVILEEARWLGNCYECRVRLPDGSLEEVVISAQEAEDLAGAQVVREKGARLVEAEKLRTIIESARIRLAYAYDPQFAVSISGIQTLPHQIEAVYQKMLPQARLRFLLADDPGAGKTIMAGLFIKEMKLREVIERILVLCPAPLTIQWQDEMLHWFGEPFDIIYSAVDQQQLANPWQRSAQIISSMDYAKRDGVRERVWNEEWDLVVIDEAHKCSATLSKPEGTKRYQLARRLTDVADHVLLLTATPHHGDEGRFGYFLRLLDPDLFPEPHRLGQRAHDIRKRVLRLGDSCPWVSRHLKEDLKDLDGNRLFTNRYANTVEFYLNEDEYSLYKAVTGYINTYVPQQTGRRRTTAALTRTVFQRRLASSACAIHESIKRRLRKQQVLLDELEVLPPKQRARKIALLQGRLEDVEQDDSDLDEETKDELLDEFSVAEDLDQLRREIAALEKVEEQSRQVRDMGRDSKLEALYGNVWKVRRSPN